MNMTDYISESLVNVASELEEKHKIENDPFLLYLLNAKQERNIDKLRHTRINIESIKDTNVLQEWQKQFSKMEYSSKSNKYNSSKEIEKTYRNFQIESKKRRLTIDFDSTDGQTSMVDDDSIGIIDGNTNDAVSSSIEKEDEGLIELRKRLLGGLSNNETDNEGLQSSVEKQIEENEGLQSGLIEDMTKLVSSLREGASAFQNALDEDTNVLGAAEIGVQVASRSLTNVSGKLKTYDKKKLGYMFYIAVALFMVVGLVLTFIIIKLFPAL